MALGTVGTVLLALAGAIIAGAIAAAGWFVQAQIKSRLDIRLEETKNCRSATDAALKDINGRIEHLFGPLYGLLLKFEFYTEQCEASITSAAEPEAFKLRLQAMLAVLAEMQEVIEKQMHLLCSTALGSLIQPEVRLFLGQSLKLLHWSPDMGSISVMQEHVRMVNQSNPQSFRRFIEHQLTVFKIRLALLQGANAKGLENLKVGLEADRQFLISEHLETGQK